MKLIIYILSLFDRYNQKKIIDFFKNRNFQIKIFFDVGAHRGETIKLFKKNLKIQNFYCFEPSPVNFFFLKKKITKMNLKINIFNFALGEKQSELTLNQEDESSSSTLNEINKESNYYKKKNKILNIFGSSKNNLKKINVEVKCLNDIMKEKFIERIDILKTDTEGFELFVLKGAREKIKNIKYIYFEHHFDDMLVKKYTLSDIHNYLIKNGFQKKFKVKMFFRKSFEYIYENMTI